MTTTIPRPGDELEQRLRASLDHHAGAAPTGQLLTERILAATAGMPEAPRRPRRSLGRTVRTWTMPLAAAAAVAAVVATVTQLSDHHRTGAPAPVAQGPSTVRPSTGVSSTPSSGGSAASSSVGSSPTSSVPVSVTQLSDVRVTDLSFAGADTGWALATADCLTGSGTCSALLQTTDGTTWTAVVGPDPTPFNVPGVSGGCSAPCVENLRFATDTVGYAYGPSALFLTTDGGGSWTQLSGGAQALETLDNNVIRVSTDKAGASVETAAIGSDAWTATALPDWPAAARSVVLQRNGHTAVIAALGYDAGDPAASTRAAFYTSGNDGTTWTASGDPCPNITAGYLTVAGALAVGSGADLVVDCVTTTLKSAAWTGGVTLTSTDGGAHWNRPTAGGKLGPAALLATPDGTNQFAWASGSAGGTTGRPTLYASTDQGNSWTAVPGVTAGLTPVFLGFESDSVGRLVACAASACTQWTTTDGGRSWQSSSF